MSPFIETIRIEGGVIHNVAFHNERMNATRRDLLATDGRIDLASYLQPESYLERTKCRVEYSHDIESVTYTPYQIRPVRSVRLVACDTIDYRYKSTDRSRLDALFAAREEADDVLIVRNGLLTDTSICNLALWNGDAWITPASPLLPGTMRASLLASGTILPGNLRPEELSGYPRLRLFNALIGFGEVEITFPSAQTVSVPQILCRTSPV